MSKDVKGIAASDGIGIAPAYLLIDPDLSYDKDKKVEDTDYRSFVILILEQMINAFKIW